MNLTSIVPVSESEVHLLQKISLDTFAETYRAQNTRENFEAHCRKSFSLEQLTAELKQTASAFYFIYYDGQLTGYIKINFEDAQTEKGHPKSLELERIYVMKDYQGKGLGRLLLNKALEIAKSSGLHYVWLGVWEKNPNAIGFYDKLGFVPFGTHIFKLGDDLQTDIMMKYQL